MSADRIDTQLAGELVEGLNNLIAVLSWAVAQPYSVLVQQIQRFDREYFQSRRVFGDREAARFDCLWPVLVL